MRLLLTVFFIMLQVGCTALLLGGGQSGQYPVADESGQTNGDCDEELEKEECD